MLQLPQIYAENNYFEMAASFGPMEVVDGKKGVGPFRTSQQAYDTLHIGDPNNAAKLQAESRAESASL